MSQTKIYVGNLSYSTTPDQLQAAFSEFGNIAELKLIEDRETGRSKGFAFITYEQPSAAESALSLNGTDLDGRQIKVSLAREDRDRGTGTRRRQGNGGFRQHRD